MQDFTLSGNRTFATEGSIQLIKSCKSKSEEKTLESLSRIQAKIAEYPIENITKAKIDEPPEEFIELCLALAKTGIAIAEVNGIIIEPQMKGLMISAEDHLEHRMPWLAADKVLDVIDRLRYKGVLII